MKFVYLQHTFNANAHCTRLRFICERSQSLHSNEMIFFCHWNELKTILVRHFDDDSLPYVFTRHMNVPQETYLFQWLWQWAVHVLFLIICYRLRPYVTHWAQWQCVYSCRRWEIWIHSILFYSIDTLYIYLFIYFHRIDAEPYRTSLLSKRARAKHWTAARSIDNEYIVDIVE